MCFFANWRIVQRNISDHLHTQMVFFFVSLLFIFDSGPVNSKITSANLHNVAAATAAAAATATAANAVHTEQVHWPFGYKMFLEL